MYGRVVPWIGPRYSRTVKARLRLHRQIFSRPLPSNGDTLTISDGNQTRVYEFHNLSANFVSPGNIFINIANTNNQTAKSIEAAIQHSFGIAAGALGTIYTHFSGATNTVHLTNNNKSYLYGNPQILNQTITTTAGAGVFELFGFAGAVGRQEKLRRKYFYKDTPQIIDGIMISEQFEDQQYPENLVSSSVEYYFDVSIDKNVDQLMACKNMDQMNKESYYVDFDFECSRKTINPVYHDIYGSEVEPEICLD